MPCQPKNIIFLEPGDINNFDEAAAKVKIKYNRTQLKNYNTSSPPPPEWIDVESLPPPVQYTPFCVPDYQCGDGVNGLQWCWPVDDTYYKPCLTGSFDIYGVGGMQWHNCYSQSNDTGSSLCLLRGHKEVYASGIWLGRKSYTSRELMKDDSFGWCCSCLGAGQGGFHKPDYAPDNVKYRTVNADATVEYSQDNYDVTIDPNQVECCCLNNGVDCGGCSEGSDGCECTWGSCVYKNYTDTTTYTAFGSSTCTIDKYGNLHGSCTSGSSGWCHDDNPDYQYACLANAAADGFSGCGVADTNYTFLIGMWCAGIKTWVGCEGCHEPDVLSWDDSTGTGHAEWHVTIYDYDGCGCITNTRDEIQFEMTLTQTSFDSHTYGVNNIRTSVCPCDSYSPEWIEIANSHADYSATSTHASSFGFNPSWSNAFIGTRTSEGSLADPYTPDEVYDDVVNNLLSTWDLGSTIQYPWQNDGAKTKGPWVSRDATGGAPSIGYCSSSNTYTGRIIGAPAPEGLDKCWNPSAPVMCVCDDPNNPGNYCQYIDHYGQWSTDGCGVPRATQWLDTFQSNNIPDGAFVGTNFMYTMPCRDNSNGPSKISDDVIWACKTAEILMPNIQEFAYSRPCGSDRWQVSSSGTNCIRGFTGDTVTIDVGEYGGGPNYIQMGNVSICGTGDRDGIYKVTGLGADTITVGDCLVSASSFPFNPYFNCGTGFIGQVKWKSVPGICGSASIDSIKIDDSGSAIITLTEGSWLISGDQVIVYGANGMTGVNGVQTLYMMDDDSTTFKLDGSTASGSLKLNSLPYIICPFTPDPKWAITDPQGNFMVKKWSYNFRDVGEYYRLLNSYPYEVDQMQCGDWPQPACVPTPIPTNPRTNQCGLDQNVTTMSCVTMNLKLSQCKPNAIYFSPNIESFNDGSDVVIAKNGGWFTAGPDGPYADSQYGTMWQAIAQQTIDDPLAPYVPCLCGPDVDPNTEYVSYDCNACSYAQDDGTCQPDQNGDQELGIPCIKHYPATNQYSAECTYPSGSPHLPPGINFGCATTPPANCTDKNVCSAPYAPADFPDGDTCNPYLVNVVEAPWLLMENKESCVCGGGTWADYYSRNGVTCQVQTDEDGFPPP